MIHIEIAAERLTTLFGIPITNTLLMSWVVVIFLIILSQIISRKIALVPKGLQNIVEIGVEKLVGLMESVMHSREKAEKYFPFVATIFVLVLISNWFGIIPGVGSIGIYQMKDGTNVLAPFFRSGASDLNFTLALAAITVVMVNIYGILSSGFLLHAKKFFNFSNPINFFVGILELIAEFAKVISFSFRLFGNIFAGEVLLITVGFLAPYIVPIPFLGLEIFVGFIQALVFAMLTIVFLSISLEHAH